MGKAGRTMELTKDAKKVGVRRTSFLSPVLIMRLMLATFCGLCLIGWLVFYLAILRYGDPPKTFPRTGVVFTGGPVRVAQGLHLLRTGAFDAVLISGVHAKALPALKQQSKRLPLTLGTRARDTRGNVEETRKWLRKQHTLTFTLITSDFHMPRALFLLKKYAPALTPVPWGIRTPPYKRLIQSWREYSKFLWSFLWAYAPKLRRHA